MMEGRMLGGFAVADSVQMDPEHSGSSYPKPEPAATLRRSELVLPGREACQGGLVEVGDQGISGGLKLTCPEGMFGLWFRRPPGRRIWEMGAESGAY